MLCSYYSRAGFRKTPSSGMNAATCQPAFLPEKLFKTSSPGWGRERGWSYWLCLLSKPQLSEFQTPRRKWVLATNHTVWKWSRQTAVPPLSLSLVTMGAFRAELVEASLTPRTCGRAAAPKHGDVYPRLQGDWNKRIVTPGLKNKSIVGPTMLILSCARY